MGTVLILTFTYYSITNTICNHLNNIFKMGSLGNVLFFLKTIIIGCLILATGTFQHREVNDKCWAFNNAISCADLEDGDLPIPDGTFPHGIYDSIGIFWSPN